MRYLTLAPFKAYVRSEIVIDDDLYTDAINAAEMWVDNALVRHVALADALATARTFATPSRYGTLFIDDCTEITSVVDNGATLVVATDYRAEPINALSASGEPCPYDRLVRPLGYWNGLTYGSFATATTVVVTAKWGWPAIPPMIKETCKIVAKDMLSQRDLKFGLVTVTEVGGVGTRSNQVVRETIERYRSPKSWGVA